MANMRWSRFNPRRGAVRNIVGPTLASGFLKDSGITYADLKASGRRNGSKGAEGLRAKKVKITLAPVR